MYLQSADQLAENGRPCGTVYAHMVMDDQQIIEQDVQQAGNQQKIQRVSGISKGTQRACRKLYKILAGIPRKMMRI